MITLSNISKRHGQQVLFVGASCQLNSGEKVGLVGPNGAGKSTLFRLIVGEEKPDEGEINYPKRTVIGYFRQEHDDMRGRSVLDETIAGSGELGALHVEMVELEKAMSDPARQDEMDAILARFGDVQERYSALGGYEIEARAMEILHGLGFSDEQIAADVGGLSGGWKMRVGMAKVLLMQPDVLLMDEPTNHLDIESILWLEGYLAQSRATLWMTCHDRDFMNRVVDRLIDVDDGELVSYGGNYDFFEREQKVRASQREAAFQRQEAMIAKMQKFIDRFGTHVAKAAQAQSRAKKIDKIERIEPPKHREVVPFRFVQPPRSGNDVVQIKGLAKRFGANVVYDGFDLTIQRGERWCVMGRNGSGKSTLLKMVAGQLAADDGTVRIGASVKMGYFAQQALDVLNPALTVMETVDRAFPLVGEGTKRNLLGAFQFSGHDIDKIVRILSGGEKSRLVLALMMFDPPNFMVLDEPTNHLDLMTKQMLVETLKDFEGTMLFVSHDRTFLRGLANRVLDVSREGPGSQPKRYDGSYVEWVERTGSEAPGVHR